MTKRPRNGNGRGPKGSAAAPRRPKSNMALPVLWAAPLFTPTGYGDEARGFVKGLCRLGVPLQVRPIDTDIEFAKSVAVDDPEFYTDVVASFRNEADQGEPAATAVLHLAALAPFRPVGGARFTIARTMWETNGLPHGAAARLNSVDEVWVPSQFNADTFHASGVEVPIRVIGGGVDTHRFRPGLAPLAVPGSRKTLFLAMFEWSHRKGWDVLLRGWAEAFAADADVSLMLRVYPRNHFANTDDLPRLAEQMVDEGLAELGLDRSRMAPILTLGNHLTPPEVPRLMAAADCYVAPGRGEGWGRPQHEAMALGLPVIATRWGGSLEFMDDSNSLLLDVERLVTVDERMDIAHYRGQLWAEPSVEHLAALLRQVADGPDDARRIGRAARAAVEQRWQWKHIAGIAAARLLEIDDAERGVSGAMVLVTGADPADSAPSAAPLAGVVPLATASGEPATYLILADAREALADDTLLSAFATTFRSSDPITLVLYGPGMLAREFEANLRTIANRCGLDLEDGPKLHAILPPDRSAAADAAVGANAYAYLSSRVPEGRFADLPVIHPDGISELGRQVALLGASRLAATGT